MSNPFNFWNMPDEVYGAMEDDYIFGMSSEPSTKTLYDRQDRYRRRVLGLTDPENYDDVAYHEELKNYQQERARIAGDEYPSKAKTEYWIYAESTKKYKKPTKWSGKWCSFHPPDQMDAAWEQVKDATERGLLGGKAKVSTLKGFRGKEYVIIIYTYNWKDESDVMNIRQTLRDLGFTKPMSYKADSDTLAGRYHEKGKKLAKYYE